VRSLYGQDGLDEAGWERAMDRVDKPASDDGVRVSPHEVVAGGFEMRSGKQTYWLERVYLDGDDLLLPVYVVTSGVQHQPPAHWCRLDIDGTLHDWPTDWSRTVAVALRLWVSERVPL